jgi:SAM-dependent methyltransferase
MTPKPRLDDATYARKQIFSRVGLLAWSHRRRLAFGRELLAARPAGSLLDYGCGDGSFIDGVYDAVTEALGVEIDATLVAQGRARFADVPNVRFELPAALASLPPHGFDTVTCMEVLEHCTADARRAVLETLHRHVRPGGVVVISVPNETGAVLVLKQAVRALAGLRGYSDYRQRETYSPRELVTMLGASADTVFDRPRYPSALPDGPPFYHGHKGFNWRALHRELQQLFDVAPPRFSPVDALGSSLASQVWFLCSPRPSTLP